jgi:uncharacterized membrane protein
VPSVRRAAAGTVALAVVVGFLTIAATYFFLHDALPYIVNHTEEAYRRYWPDRRPLLVHILGGSIALLTGPFQLWSGFRRRLPRVHRLTGFAYIGAVAFAASAAFYLTFHAKADFGLSLFVLAVMWWISIGMAYTAVRNGRLDAHREWMIRSYIVTFAFVSYRYMVGLSVFRGLGSGREASVLWLSWVVPMMCFELYLQRHRVAPLKRRSALVRP